MSNKHTPGPWSYEGGNDFAIEINLPNDNIISIDRGCRFTGKYVMSRDELNANGRLIAYAPDMYDLLNDFKTLNLSVSSVARELNKRTIELLNRIDQ
jgi:hypothetical protein